MDCQPLKARHFDCAGNEINQQKQNIMNSPLNQFSEMPTMNNSFGFSASQEQKPKQKYKENFISKFKKGKKPQGKFTSMKTK